MFAHEPADITRVPWQGTATGRLRPHEARRLCTQPLHVGPALPTAGHLLPLAPLPQLGCGQEGGAWPLSPLFQRTGSESSRDLFGVTQLISNSRKGGPCTRPTPWVLSAAPWRSVSVQPVRATAAGALGCGLPATCNAPSRRHFWKFRGEGPALETTPHPLETPRSSRGCHSAPSRQPPEGMGFPAQPTVSVHKGRGLPCLSLGLLQPLLLPEKRPCHRLHSCFHLPGSARVRLQGEGLLLSARDGCWQASSWGRGGPPPQPGASQLQCSGR